MRNRAYWDYREVGWSRGVEHHGKISSGRLRLTIVNVTDNRKTLKCVDAKILGMSWIEIRSILLNLLRSEN